MPTYHFRCTECQSEEAKHLPLGSTEQPTCKACKKSMIKFMVPPTVHFKGSGFYKTDSTHKVTASTKTKEVDVKEAKPAETSADAKPAEAKTETKSEPIKKEGSTKKTA
jgi:putative FmdB family regulatory protein